MFRLVWKCPEGIYTAKFEVDTRELYMHLTELRSTDGAFREGDARTHRSAVGSNAAIATGDDYRIASSL
jgi:hypothetical protein